MGVIDAGRLENEIRQGRFRPIMFDDSNILVFEDTVKLVRSHDIPMALVYIPTIDLLNRAEPEKHLKAIEKLQAFSKKDKGIFFIDYNGDYQNRHELFYDQIHMNPEGQKVITGRLIDDLMKILNPQYLARQHPSKRKE
jgi:hypothetical protein